MTWGVVVLGGANYDYLIRGKRLPKPGETADGDVFLEAPGGKGANQAVAVARLGGRVTFLGRIGKDRRGDELLLRLQAESVNCRHLGRDPKAPTGVALIFVDGRGQKEIMAFPGANRQMQVGDVEAWAHTLRSARVVLTQLEIPLECTRAALLIARSAGVPVVLDPAPAIALPTELLRLIDVIRPNATEAEILTGIPVRDRASARQAAGALLDRGVRAVAVQAGDDGNLLVWPQGEQWLPKLPVATVDATGAGDAFAAGLAVCLAEGLPLEKAGPFANAAAALATTAVGAQAGLPRREEVTALLGKAGRP